MNKRSIHTFVMRFLETYGCTIVEKTPASVTVKLSPEADREMTGRPYYWSFVERTGAPAETMTYTFVFDPEAYEAEAKMGKAAAGAGQRAGGRSPGAEQSDGAASTGAAAGAASAGAGAASAGAGAAGAGANRPASAAGAGAAVTGADGPAGAAGAGATGAGVAGAAGAGAAGAAMGGAYGAAGAGTTGAGAVNAGAGAGMRAAGMGGAAGDGAPGGQQQQQPGSAPGPGGADSILGRYFGFVPTTVATRVPRDEMTLGSRRLEQLFDIVLEKGRFVHLFEEPFLLEAPPRTPLVYDTWFCVNYKVELACDRKRSEIHSLAMQLNSGEIREHFHKQLLTKAMSPKLPANIHILPDTITLHKAMSGLEAHLERTVARYDHRWAHEASEQHLFELQRVEGYYDGLLMGAEPEQRPQIEAQCRNRLQEIDWQYKPRIAVSVINCGLFHLNASRSPRN